MSLIDRARQSEVNSYFKLEEEYGSLVDHVKELDEKLKQKEAECERFKENQKKLIEALGWNMHDENCRFDRNGNCQEHYCFEGNYSCYHKDTKELLDQLKSEAESE